MLNELSKQIRLDNASKGFDPTEGGVNRYLLLAISEICEAQDDLRNGWNIHTIKYWGQLKGIPIEMYYDEKHEGFKPCGFSIEIADCAIRILDIGGKFDIDFETAEEAPDYEDRPIDDWLLGICENLAVAGNYIPKTEVDFEIYLLKALGCILLLCEKLEIPIMDIIQEKLAYNRTRPPKHGRQF